MRNKIYQWAVYVIKPRFGVMLLAGSFALAACASMPVRTIALDELALNTIPSGSFAVTSPSAHMGFGVRVGPLGDLRGDFTVFEAQLTLIDAAKGTAHLSAKVDTRSASLTNSAIEKMMHSPAWFAVDHFPTAEFVGTQMGWNADGTGELVGTMTIRGVRRDEVFTFQLTCDAVEACPQRAVGFEAAASLNRADYGMTQMQGVVGGQVNLRVEGMIVFKENTLNPEQRSALLQLGLGPQVKPPIQNLQ